MRVFESKVRQVGTSLGVLIPKEIANEGKIKENEIVQVAIIKKDLSLLEEAFGCVKTKPFRRDHKDRVI
ncbi:MAG: hypothetical protein PHD95_03800 [Candidatus ainarchaeum sp.]|nr:hypothetical protein [Candidatus ainarchaeum sp.]